MTEQELLRLQRVKYKVQFGYEQPPLDAVCKYCGRPFGEHAGSECPELIEILADYATPPSGRKTGGGLDE